MLDPNLKFYHLTTILHNSLVQQSSQSPCDRSMEVVLKPIPREDLFSPGGLVEAGYSVSLLPESWVSP